MSSSLIARSPDLQRLLEEGYELEEQKGYLLMRSVPYVAPDKHVRRGVLITSFSSDTERALPPTDHTMYFAGEMPSHPDGSPMTELVIGSPHHMFWEGMTGDHYFSRKPKDSAGVARSYTDHYEKFTTYAALLTKPAREIEPDATARTFRIIEPEPDASPFVYLDTASSRAGITRATSKLEGQRLAVVGGGGTAGYVVDFIAKTPVAEIHIFDGDVYSAHNAFRTPGAMAVRILRKRPNKAAYLSKVYRAMHRHVVAHTYPIDATTVAALDTMDYVFLCMDPVPEKKLIIDHLQARNIPFIDVGMGLYENDGSIGGKVRTTTSVPGMQQHIARRISLVQTEGANEYERNIQIAELNALNAALAVIKWKKLRGFYFDLGEEHHSTYTLTGNTMTNADRRPCHQ